MDLARLMDTQELRIKSCKCDGSSGPLADICSTMEVRDFGVLPWCPWRGFRRRVHDTARYDFRCYLSIEGGLKLEQTFCVGWRRIKGLEALLVVMRLQAYTREAHYRATSSTFTRALIIAR